LTHAKAVDGDVMDAMVASGISQDRLTRIDFSYLCVGICAPEVGINAVGRAGCTHSRYSPA